MHKNQNVKYSSAAVDKLCLQILSCSLSQCLSANFVMQRFVCRVYKVCLQRYNLCHAEVVQRLHRGCAEAVQGLCRGCIVAAQWLHSGCTVTVQRLCRGCAEALHRLCRGCTVSVQRLCRGCAEAVQRLCRGCARAVQTWRLCRGCIQTNFCRQSLSYCRQSLSTVDKVCHLVDVADELVGMQTNFVSSGSADKLCQQVLQTNFVSSLYSTHYTVYSIQYTDNVCGRYEKVSDFMTNFVICMTN